MDGQLTDKHRRIVQRVAAGEDWRVAAKAEGCTDSYSRVIGHRLRKNPVVVKMLEAIQSKGREIAAYDLAKAMTEAQEVIDFAKLHKHPTAFFFAVRHRAHLSGLLVDEIHLKTENLDLKGALAEARHRTFGPPINITSGQRNTPLSAQQALPDARGTEPDTDSSGSAGSGQDRAFGD